MEPKQQTLENLFKDLIRQVVKEEINLAFERHLPLLTKALQQQQQSTPEIMDIAGTAQYLKLSKATVYRMVQQMQVPNYKRGKRLYLYKSDLDEYVMCGKRKTYDEIREEAENYLIRRRRR